MIVESTLMRTAERICHFIENYADVVGPEKRDEVVEFFGRMHQVFPQWVISTCPAMHPDIEFISPNCYSVLGVDAQFMLKNLGLTEFFSHVHEADQKDLLACIRYMHDFLEGIAPEQHYRYRTILHYRFRKGNGQFIYLYDQRASLLLPGSGNLYYGLFRDVTEESAFGGVRAEIYIQNEILDKIEEFKPSAERNRLSKREQELVAFIRQGLSTKEIAWYLKISPNTVRNIKSKLFEKYNVNNSIELLNVAV